MPLDVLLRELGENVQNARALESVHPMNHQEPNVQRQPSEDLTPRDSGATKQENVQLNVQRSPQHNVLGWRIQPVPFVGRKLVNRGSCRDCGR